MFKKSIETEQKTFRERLHGLGTCVTFFVAWRDFTV